MKRLLTIFTIFFTSLSVFSQNNVFVLVDVSKSVKQSDLISAKQVLTEILLGSTPNNSNIVGGSLTDLAQFKIKINDKISVVKFGSQITTLSISPNPVYVTNISTDIYSALNSFPLTPTDNNTYYTLAKAKIAEYAKKNNISKYMLCIISDENEDNFGPGGKPNYQSQYIQELVDNYDTKTNPATANPAILVKLNSSSQDFKLRFIPSIDVSKYNLPGAIPPAVVDTNSSNAVITITSPQEAKKNKEYEMNSESLNINWSCPNCPQGIKYTVMVSEYDGGRFREIKKDLAANSLKVKVPDGKFRITVSSSNYPATSDFTFVKVSTNSLGWFFALIIIASASAIGYYFWNKKRQEKIDLYSSNKTDDFFSSGNGGATTNNSTNSDYF
jgi:hypothetical protein